MEWTAQQSPVKGVDDADEQNSTLLAVEMVDHLKSVTAEARLAPSIGGGIRNVESSSE